MVLLGDITVSYYLIKPFYDAIKPVLSLLVQRKKHIKLVQKGINHKKNQKFNKTL